MSCAGCRGNESFRKGGVAQCGKSCAEGNGVLAALGVCGAGMGEIYGAGTAKGMELFDVELGAMGDERGKRVVQLQNVGPVAAVGGKGEVGPAA